MKNPRSRSIFHDILRFGFMTAIAVTLVLIPRVASAHAVLVQSSPSANGIAQGPDVPIKMKFNSRVDGTRSTLLLSGADGKSSKLTIDSQADADTLTAKATGLSSGEYKIQWQVLAVDGHITRGQIPFAVK